MSKENTQTHIVHLWCVSKMVYLQNSLYCNLMKI